MSDPDHKPETRTPATMEDLRSRAVLADEPEVDHPSSWPEWSAILAGPVIWIVHFFIVYLLAEDVCAEVVYGTTGSPVSEPSMRTIIIVVTIVTALVCVGLGAAGWSKVRAGTASFATQVGTMLTLGAAVAVLLVGLSAIWVGTC